MREILFRAKIVDDGEWVYGAYHYSADSKYHYILSLEKFLERDSELSLHNKEVYFVIPESVGQFTGISDINDVKLFEGDIVNGCCFNGSYAFGVISFYESSFVVLPIGKFIEGISDVKSNIIERIGNIHDNPELAQSQSCT